MSHGAKLMAIVAQPSQPRASRPCKFSDALESLRDLSRASRADGHRPHGWQTPRGLKARRAAGIVFSFYNDQLSKVVVDYDHDRTAGMTDADLIEAISTTYGPALKPAVKQAPTVVSQLEEESGMPVARWRDTDYSVVLYRSSYASGFRIIVTSPRLEALARSADKQAIRLDEREAPQREIARQKKEVEDTRLAQERARIANKAAFRP